MTPAPLRGRRSSAPLVFSLLILAVVTGASVRAAMALCDGHLVYALDDAYIHLAMARTLAETGVWGVTPHTVAFASSSPGWTMLLAAGYRVGLTSVWLPIALNLVAAAVLIVTLDVAARRLLSTDRARLWLLVSVVFVTPVPALVLSGMEALSQVAAVAAFIGLAARANRPDDGTAGPSAVGLALVAGVACALRYESAFVVAVAAALFAARRRWRLAAAVCIGAAVPVAAYGVFGLLHGGWWLPTSVVLKSEPPDFRSFAGVATFLADKGLPALFTQPPLPSIVLVLLVLIAAFTWRSHDLAGEAEGWVLIAAGAILVHIHLVNFEWLYRYKAYLVAPGVCACVFGLSKAWASFELSAGALRRPLVRYVALLLLAAALTGPLAVTAIDALSRGIRGSRAIYLQQYQMAQFLVALGGGGAVVVNDIGAVAYYTRRPVVDLFGLATQEVAVKRRTRTLTTEDIDALVRRSGARVAVLYAQRFSGSLAPPLGWQPLATWSAAESATVAYDTVTFYSTSTASAPEVQGCLRRFVPMIPTGISVHTLSEPGRDEPSLSDR